MGIPGEDLPGSWPATAFVAWYNGHPDFQDLGIDLAHERAVVVGNGNVAIDVARMLALTAEELRPTDTVDAAAQAIVDSPLREIVMLGRRGPVQAAFTPPELQELGELAGADVIVDPADLVLDAASERALEEDRERARRNVDLLNEYALRAPAGKPRAIRLRFLVSPVAILGEDRVEGVEIVHNELVEEGGRIVARPTGEREVIEAGHRLPQRRLPGRRAARRAVRRGPRDDPERRRPRGRVPTARYCAGWIKRGPSGVIGTNKKDATETVEELLADARAGKLVTRRRVRDARGSARRAGASRYVEYAGWQAIDAAERAAGEPLGRPRVKLVGWDELLETGTPALALSVMTRHGRNAGAVGRRDAQGGRQLPRLR